LSSPTDEPAHPTREEMLAYLEDRGIGDPQVMAAMARVPRHAFVPEEVRHRAYGQRPLPIGQGQTISTPFIVASMTELLELQGTERVLEIGTGCGYQTAVLCEMVREVCSIEIVAKVAEFGARNLARLGYSVNLRVGDGADGWPDRAPFDRILLAATAPRIPRSLLNQLAIGGIALGPEEAPPGEGDPHDREVLARYQRLEQGFERTEIYGVRFVPMTGKVQQ